MDNRVPNNANPITAGNNPFLKKYGNPSSNNIPQGNVVNSFFSNAATPSFNTVMSTSNNKTIEVDSQKENQQQNTRVISSDKRLKRVIRNTANIFSNNLEALPKVEVKLSIANNLCEINHRSIRRPNDLIVQNTRQTKACLDLANKKVERIESIKKRLSKLYLHIQSNNSTLLNKAENIYNPFNQYEIDRLLQGLVFYKPNQKFEILSQPLKKHILGPQIKQVAKRYNLDVLKAFYAVKQVYIQQKTISQDINDFNFTIQKSRMIDIQRLFHLVEKFMNEDKKSLLMIYGMYLLSESKPSKGGICKTNQEISILWANLHMMKNQSPKIQQMIFEIYKKYTKYQHTEKYLLIELEAMRKRFENINQNFGKSLVQMSIQRMLEQGQFNLSQCKGHYLDLAVLLVKREPINYQEANQRLSNVDLQLKWFDYFKAYIKDLSFDQSKQKQQIARVSYLYKLCKLFYLKNISLQKELQQKLVKIVSTNCSIILGFMFIELMQNKGVMPFMLKQILKYSQNLLLQKQAEDGKIIHRMLPQLDKYTDVVDLAIEFIQRTLQGYIKSDQLSLLQIQLSSGRKIIHTFYSTDAPLQIIIYYICVLNKFSSFSAKIQKNIQQILRLLKTQNYENVNSSVRYYNEKMYTKALNSAMIASHMVLMVDMTEQPFQKAQFIQKWLLNIERQGFNEDFNQFIIVLNKLIQDVDSNTQIQISVNTIQTFLSCFKESISFFINYHSTPQNIKNKLNLFTMFIKICEWQNLISKQVPESILYYKFQLKTQIELLASRLYDKLTLPNHSMSQKLTIIYQLITTDRSYNSNMQFSISVLSDILVKQKQISTLQFYRMIAQQLKKQKGIEPLVALCFITQLQQNLAKLLINQIGLHLCASLKQQTQLSLITIQKMVRLSINLFYYFSPPSKMHEKEKLKILFRLIHDRLYLWLKNKRMTSNFFRNLFDLLCICKNSIPYQYHIAYMISAKRQKLLSSFTQQNYKKIGIHMLYILSLRLSKNSCLLDIENQNQIQKFQEQLQVFTEMEINILTHYSKEQNLQISEQIYAQRYIRKLNKILLQCFNQPLINEVSKSLLRKVDQTLNQMNAKSSNNIFLKKEKALVKQYLDSSNDLQRGTDNLNKPFQLLNCKSCKDFNQILQRNLNQLALNPQNQLNELEISKTINFIDNNSEHLINYFYLSIRLIQSKPLDFILLQLINKIISKIDPNNYSKKQNKTIIKGLVNQMTSNLSSFNDLYSIRLNRQFIFTINSVIQNSLLSPFEISSICSPTLGEILHVLRKILFKWTTCNIPSLHYLGQIQLILNHYPTGTNCNKKFTLWNLVQYRQKLNLLEQILQYARELSGLFDIKKYSLVQIVVQFTTFLVVNQANLKARQTQQKIRSINKLLNSLPVSPKNLFNFISKDISISQLKKITWHIVQQLNYLNFEYTSFQAEFFQNFSPAMTQ